MAGARTPVQPGSPKVDGRFMARGCSILATLAVVGDYWSLAVIRCATYGLRRFAQFERELGVAPNVLADRLGKLLDAGILEKVRYQIRPERHEYVLTARGVELVPIVVALKLWGDRHLQERGPLFLFRHRGCSSAVEVLVGCPDCGTTLGISDVEAVPAGQP